MISMRMWISSCIALAAITQGLEENQTAAVAIKTDETHILARPTFNEKMIDSHR